MNIFNLIQGLFSYSSRSAVSATGTNAAYTIPNNTEVVILPVITANRIVTLPTMVTGQYIDIYNKNNAGFTWSPAGITVKDAAGTTLTTFSNSTLYRCWYDGTNLIACVFFSQAQYIQNTTTSQTSTNLAISGSAKVGTLQIPATTSGDANITYTTGGTNGVIILSVITANRTATFSSINTGTLFTVRCINTAAFTWTTAGTIVWKDLAGNTFTTFANSTVYNCFYDGTNVIILGQYAYNYNVPGTLTVAGQTTLSSKVRYSLAAGTLTFASAMTPDFTNADVLKVTMTANATMALPTNMDIGMTATIIVTNGSGPYTMTWNASYKCAGGTKPNLTATNAAVDVFSIFYDGTNYYLSAPMLNAS